MKNVLIHRYDNALDIHAIEGFGCSEVNQRSADDSFDIVIVVPTLAAKTQTCVVADRASGQYEIDTPKDWPGKRDRYRIRVEVKNVRYTVLAKAKRAIIGAGVRWRAQWVVLPATLDPNLLF